MGSCWPPPFAPQYRPRRSHHPHLDSSSYRALVRIFSLCLDFKTPTAASEGCKDPILDGKDCSVSTDRPIGVENGEFVIQIEGKHCVPPQNDKVSILDAQAENSGSGGAVDCVIREIGGSCDDLGCAGIANSDFNVVSGDKLRCENSDFHEGHLYLDAKDENAGSAVVTDDAPARDEATNESVPEPIICEAKDATLENGACFDVNEVEQQKCVADVNSAFGVDETVEFSFCDQLPLDSLEEHIDWLATDLCGFGSSEKFPATGKCDEVLKSLNEESKAIELDEVLGPEVNCSGLKSLCQDLVNSEDDEDVEEGQIPDDFLSSEEEVVDGGTNGSPQEAASADGSLHRPCVGISGKEGLDDSSSGPSTVNLYNESRRLRQVYYGDIVSDMPNQDGKQASKHLSWNNGHLPNEVKDKCVINSRVDANSEAVGAKASCLPGNKKLGVSNESNVKGQPLSQNEKLKKKRGGSTEQRKAKRKIAKKRKRAQKEREQGVKRLKLHPIVKPKVIQYCNFYLKGRCQQGDLCKFSHDAIPLTKSEPCKYLATDSCLKGDDCPFDHELSKYPCHNILLKGSCHRGDACKFSHKVPAEGSSLKETTKNLASPVTAEKLILGKEKGGQQTSAIVNSPLKAKGIPLSMHKESVGKSLQPSKEPLRIPKGIRFISFGSEQSVKKQEDKLIVENYGGMKKNNQQNHETYISSVQKNEESLNEKPLTVVVGAVQDSASNTFVLNSLEKKASIANGEMSVVKNFENESSDASKILQEFLFGGLS